MLIALAPGVPAAHTTPLTLAEVLQSSARTARQIVESLAKVRQAQGKEMSADGAFDTVFDIDGRSREAGYYDGAAIESSVKRPFDNNGGYYYLVIGPRVAHSRSMKTSPTPTAVAK